MKAAGSMALFSQLSGKKKKDKINKKGKGNIWRNTGAETDHKVMKTWK